MIEKVYNYLLDKDPMIIIILCCLFMMCVAYFFWMLNNYLIDKDLEKWIENKKRANKKDGK